MSYYSNASQLYFDFVYDQYLNEHSESKYLLDLINVIDWSVVPNFNHKHGRLGYSNQSILKALFVQKVKGLLFVSFSTIRRTRVSLNIITSTIFFYLMIISVSNLFLIINLYFLITSYWVTRLFLFMFLFQN